MSLWSAQMSEFKLPDGATPHSVEAERDGQVVIMRGYVTRSGTFVVVDIDTVGVKEESDDREPE